MSNDKAPTYRQEQDGQWTKVTFEDLKPGDIIKMYDDAEETKMRGDCWWRVASEPYLYEEDNMGVECEPIKNLSEEDLDHE